MSAKTVEGLRAERAWRGDRTERRGLRGRASGLQRDDRSPTRFRRSVCWHADVVAAVAFALRTSSMWQFGEEDTACRVSGPRTTQSSSTCRACGTCRSIRSSRPPGLEGARPGASSTTRRTPRPRDHRRRRVDDGSGWTHLGGGIGYLARGFGLSCDNLAQRRGGDRRRTGCDGERGGKRGSLLGAPRRWRNFGS